MYHVIGSKRTRGIKNVSLMAAKKKLSVPRSTGKSSMELAMKRVWNQTSSVNNIYKNVVFTLNMSQSKCERNVTRT